jgi:hypothetical protein
MTGDPIGDSLNFSFTEPLRESTYQYPDVVTPLSGATSVFQYPDSTIGATRYSSTTCNVVYFGFGGFEAITDSVMRAKIMDRIYKWLNGFQIQHTPLNDTQSPDSQRVQVQILSASNIESVNLYWDTDGSFPFIKQPMHGIGEGMYEAYIPGQSDKAVQYTIIVRTANGYIPYSIYNYKVGTPTVINIGHSNPLDIPTTYSLDQNYPNPFNPTTNIGFQIVRFGFVSLKVYDVLGKEVTTIVSEKLQPGYYSRRWNASAMPSGIYFYRLSVVPLERESINQPNGRNGQSDTFIDTKKLVLLK